MRCEFVIDAYTDACIEKIQKLGFSSRKDAIKYALQRTADAIDRGEINIAPKDDVSLPQPSKKPHK